MGEDRGQHEEGSGRGRPRTGCRNAKERRLHGGVAGTAAGGEGVRLRSKEMAQAKKRKEKTALEQGGGSRAVQYYWWQRRVQAAGREGQAKDRLRRLIQSLCYLLGPTLLSPLHPKAGCTMGPAAPSFTGCPSPAETRTLNLHHATAPLALPTLMSTQEAKDWPKTYLQALPARVIPISRAAS